MSKVDSDLWRAIAKAGKEAILSSDLAKADKILSQSLKTMDESWIDHCLIQGEFVNLLLQVHIKAAKVDRLDGLMERAQSLDILRLSPDSQVSLQLLTTMATVLCAQYRFDSAMTLLNDAFDEVKAELDNSEYELEFVALALALNWVFEKYERAYELYEFLLKERLNTADKAWIMQTHADLAYLNLKLEKWELAEKQLRNCLEFTKEPEIANELKYRLGLALCKQDKHKDGQEICQSTFSKCEDFDIPLVNKLHNVANQICSHDRFSEATEMCQAALSISEPDPNCHQQSNIGRLERVDHIVTRLGFPALSKRLQEASIQLSKR